MSKILELPLLEPLYSTYQYQGPGTAVICANKSIKNWYLNQVMNLTCNRKFLKGFTTPELTIPNSDWGDNPYFEGLWFSTQFTKGYINVMIREMLDQGLYVYFCGVDDFYVQGKSWYKKRHFSHDGLICGYNQENKTYCIYAYDSNWVYKKFWTPQKSFNQGREAMLKKGIAACICAIKVKDEDVKFSPQTVYTNLKEYLESNLQKYPFDGDENVYGIVVHEYIAEYVTKLMDGSIPYERMDRRVFRLIWEHKQVMLERITLVEKSLEIEKEYSPPYEQIVAEADRMRMLYAMHYARCRDSVLPIIREKLLSIYKTEREILTSLVQRLEMEL